jgi:hypothetical protein
MKFDVVFEYGEQDDSMTVYVNGVEVIESNHDDDGWYGMERIRAAFVTTAELVGGTTSNRGEENV